MNIDTAIYILEAELCYTFDDLLPEDRMQLARQFCEGEKLSTLERRAHDWIAQYRLEGLGMDYELDRLHADQ